MIITFREGIEAFLIVAISFAYLHKTGRHELAKAVYAGIAVAIVASGYVGYYLQDFAGDPLAEGILGITAGVLVASLVVYMMKAGKKMRSQIHAKLETASSRAGIGAFIGVFLFTVLMITREGMETALLLSTIIMDNEAMTVLYGALAGVGLAAVLGYLWVRFSHMINLGLFMQVTSVFLLLFAVQLFLLGFHELTEAFVLPIDNAYWHMVTEPVEEGPLASIITYSIIFVPLAWLAFSALKGRGNQTTAAA